MGQPVHRFLEDFTPRAEGAAPGPVELRPRLIHRVAPPGPTPQEIERQKLQEAYDRGVEHGTAVARAAAEVQLAEAAARSEFQIEESRQMFAGALADRLAQELRTALDQAQALVSKQAATAMLPVFRRVLTESAIEDLAGELSALLNETPALVASISGPHELIERLRLAMASGSDAQRDLPLRLVFLPSYDDTTQVTVQADNAIIELRLAEWLARLDEASL